MKRIERTILVIIGLIGFTVLSLGHYYVTAWVFLMAVAFIGECIEVIASRMEKILTILESKQ